MSGSITGSTGLITGSNISYTLPLAFLSKLESIPVNTSNSTESTSTSTGSLQVQGGMGVSGNIKALNVVTSGTTSLSSLSTGTLSLGGPMTSNSISVTKSSNVNYAQISGNCVDGGNITTSLTSSLQGNLICVGLSSLTGQINGLVTFSLTSGQRGFITLTSIAGSTQASMIMIYFEYTSGTTNGSATVIAQSGDAAPTGNGLGSAGTEYLIANFNGTNLFVSHVNNTIIYYTITLL